MTDLEIDKALALAIGWKEDDFTASGFQGFAPVELCIGRERGIFPIRRRFSHKDWNVAGPIAERYDAFPLRSTSGHEWHSTFNGNDDDPVYADTPQKAIALAVIGSKK